MYIFMEYCDEGTLEEVSRLGLQEHVIRLYSKQITTAINVLHEHGIVHRDIKGNDFMLFLVLFSSLVKRILYPKLNMCLMFLYQEPTSFWHRQDWLSWVTLAVLWNWGTTLTLCQGRWTAHWEQQVRNDVLCLGHHQVSLWLDTFRWPSTSFDLLLKCAHVWNILFLQLIWGSMFQ